MTHHTDPKLGSMTLQQTDIYRGTRVRLSATGTKEFNEAYARWSTDAEFVRNYQTSPAIPLSITAVEDSAKKAFKRTNEFEFAIRTLDDDILIGTTSLEVRWNHQTATMAIGIGEAGYRGKGHGTDAARLITAFAFRELGVHRVSLIVFGLNARAIRSYEKVGYRHEATLRQAAYKDGIRQDVLVMGILRHEWNSLADADLASHAPADPGLIGTP
jgi:RimJ/RimL family protein N-acetyltransferase